MKFKMLFPAATLTCVAIVTTTVFAVEGQGGTSPAPGVTLAVNATNAQMVAEMQDAVAKINQRYGAPPFAFLFASDPAASEKVARNLADINALKTDAEKLRVENSRLAARQALLKRQTEDAEAELRGRLVQLDTSNKVLAKTSATLQQELREMQQLQFVKDKLEGEVANMALKVEQIRLLGGFAPATLTPGVPASYVAPDGSKHGAAAKGSVEIGK